MKAVLCAALAFLTIAGAKESIAEEALLQKARSAAEEANLRRRALRLWQGGRFAEAAALYEQILAICKKRLGKQHPDTAETMNQLGLLYEKAGEAEAAGRLYRNALEVRQEILGLAHPDTIITATLLAALCRDTHRHAQARSLYQQVLGAEEKVLGPEHPDITETLGNLAEVCEELGDNGKALSLYERALTIREKALGPEHPDTATALSNLGASHLRMGNYERALPLCQRALKIWEKSLGAKHPRTALALHNLAGLYLEMGDEAHALPLVQRALIVLEQTVGSDHPDTIASLAVLGGIYETMGDQTRALALSLRVVRTRERIQGLEHPDTALALNNLAVLHVSIGRYAKALELHRRAVKILKEVWGPESPRIGVPLANLAVVHAAMGDNVKASNLLQNVWRIREYQRDLILAFATEREQAAFLETIEGTVHANLSLVAERLGRDEAARRFAFSLVFASKGSIVESLAGRRAYVLSGSDPKLRKLLDEWRSVGQMLSKVAMATPPPGRRRAYLARVKELEKRKEAAEEAFARASGSFASQQRASRVRPAHVARALPKGSAVVEFAKYRSFRFKAKGKEKKWGKWNYIALVVRGGAKDAEPDVALVRLGTADQIEAAMKRWRKAAGPGQDGRLSKQAAVESASKDLAELVWKPLLPALGKCRKVYISPDGGLAFVSFAALPGSEAGKFVIDEYDITYVSTGRDLIRQGGGKTERPVLVGAPDFGKPGTQPRPVPEPKPEELLLVRSGLSDLRSFSQLNFPPLPGTLAEVRTIAQVLQGADEGPQILTGARATEAAVKAVKRPSILHLATHGFYLPDSGLEKAMAGGTRGIGGTRPPGPGGKNTAAGAQLWRHLRLKNPMHRSGVALAGANDTIFGRREAGGNDGLLTAEEVAGMDLWGTKLVVISACESGLGEVRGSEGVYGLRRAFTMAGAQNLVMSLWSVPDEATRKLMESFYRSLGKSGSPQVALLEAQRAWIKKERAAGRYPHPFCWAAFVASGSGLGLTERGTQ